MSCPVLEQNKMSFVPPFQRTSSRSIRMYECKTVVPHLVEGLAAGPKSVIRNREQTLKNMHGDLIKHLKWTPNNAG